MTERPQGPEWWQASDLKWYPPERHPNYVAPASRPPTPVTPTEPSVTPEGKSGAPKIWFVLAGTALLLVIAALVAGRVLLGTFLPGLLLVAAIAIIGITVAVRSGHSVPRRAITISAIVLVVALAVPASLKVVYPVYRHFFGDGTSQASPSSHSPRSGILTLTNAGAKRTYGFIDPSSGQYSEVASFNIPNDSQGTPFAAIAASPDFTKYSFTRVVNGEPTAGWLDSAGNFAAVSPAVAPGAFGGIPPNFTAIGFDGSGNFYYKSESRNDMYAQVYKLAAGSTTNAEKITLTPPNAVDEAGVFLNYDGTMQFGCASTVTSWLGPNAIVSAVGSEGVSNQILKWDVTGHERSGCPTNGKDATNLLPSTNTVNVRDAVGNRDGTQVAFKYSNFHGPDAAQHNDESLYIVAADGNSQPTIVHLSNITEKQLTVMTLLKWL
jgi:hypothetical protein